MNGNLSPYIVSLCLSVYAVVYAYACGGQRSQILLVFMYCVLCFETEASQSTNSRDLSASAFQYWVVSTCQEAQLLHMVLGMEHGYMANTLPTELSPKPPNPPCHMEKLLT